MKEQIFNLSHWKHLRDTQEMVYPNLSIHITPHNYFNKVVRMETLVPVKDKLVLLVDRYELPLDKHLFEDYITHMKDCMIRFQMMVNLTRQHYVLTKTNCIDGKAKV